jgi:N-acetylmuramoyl-L-alanine amidase
MQLSRGQRGGAVAEVRRILVLLGVLPAADGGSSSGRAHGSDEFDAATELAVREFQQRRGLRSDGIVDAETYRALSAARWRLGDRVLVHNATQLLVGDDVAALQRQLIEIGYLKGRADGIFGPATEGALRSFQRESGIRADGICGPATLRQLALLKRRVVGGRPELLREMAAVIDAGPSLIGKRIVLDPGHGGEATGAVAGGLVESEVVWELATRLEGRLTALGVTTWLTRGPHNGPSDDKRAQFANSQGADLVVSLHVDQSPSSRAQGIASFYYGTRGSSSAAGERLADLIQREVVSRTGFTDCGIHGKTWDLLRLTQMPAVRVELGYLTSDEDRARLMDPHHRELIVEGMLAGIQRLYLPPEKDHPTGMMRIPASLRA